MSRLRIFNSLSKKKESFVVSGNKVRMYVCGITPDGIPHLGHAFTYTFFDVLARYLRHLGYEVTYVQNLTDIDDDILARSKKARKHWRKFGQANAQIFFEDLRWLNIAFPNVYPRATDHIPEMVDIIEQLIKRGAAYEKNGSVYFSVNKYKKFGELSRIPRENMLSVANERGNNPADPNKENPLDFVLWQAQKKGEPFWPSPWGPGRPGWHIECSAMARKYLGETVDIYGGGGDLLFPHHECSLAQSECAQGKPFDTAQGKPFDTAQGKPFVRYWMHTGMLSYRGEKMSKSLGNLLLVSKLRERYHVNDIRICLLSHHYRFAWEFNEKEKQKGQKRSELFRKVWRAQSGTGTPLLISSFRSQFYNSLADDLNTPLALNTLERLAGHILQYSRERNVSNAKAFLGEAFHILGLQVEFL